MKHGKVEIYINEMLKVKGAMIFGLLDPMDYKDEDRLVKTAKAIVDGGIDVVMLGGSTGVQGTLLDSTAKKVKEVIDVPLVLFPGNMATVTKHADAIYFMSMLNARNAYWITQAQMLAAPIVRAARVEPLPVGYIMVSPGGTAGWVGDANVVPRENPKIAAALALAGEYMGNRIIITDTGSNPGAYGEGPIPKDMIRMVRSVITVPYVVSGGIKNTEQLKDAFAYGGDCVHIGTAFEESPEKAFRAAKLFSSVAKEEGLKKVKKA
jgi:phosphoglycerol geranylgeranyltransferase